MLQLATRTYAAQSERLGVDGSGRVYLLAGDDVPDVYLGMIDWGIVRPAGWTDTHEDDLEYLKREWASLDRRQHLEAEWNAVYRRNAL
jgi:hypothetical protein